MASIRPPLILTGFLILTLGWIPFQWFAVTFNLDLAKRIPNFYHRLLCKLFGIRVHIVGRPIEGGGLILANHTSWLDIIILSSVARLSFVSKAEVNDWFLFGFLARLQRTVFVRREERSKSMKDRDVIAARINEGDTLVIFPEGTSSDGNRVLPFKSTLVGAAELPLAGSTKETPHFPLVQPLSLAYVASHGMPMGRETRPSYAWYGDMELFPHLFEAFSTGPLDVVVEFHQPIDVVEAGGRKRVAALAESAVRSGLLRALHHPTYTPNATNDAIAREEALAAE